MDLYKKFKKLIFIERKQYSFFTSFITVIVILTAILTCKNDILFERFLGELDPLATILFSIVLSFLLLSFLMYKGWFLIYKTGKLKDLLPFLGILALFAFVSIIVDWNIIFPKEMNILLPESLLFYPVIAFFVEFLFHILPLTILLIILNSVFKTISFDRLLWICVLLVAMFEPTYQTIYMGSYATWAIIVVWVNLYLFNITQLMIFKKFGFIKMYSFRLLYYLLWHIIWGTMRLDVLF